MKKEEKIKKLVMGLYERPSYVKEDCINVEINAEYVDIVLFGDYHNKIYLNKEDVCLDCAVCDCGGAYGKQDLLFAADILGARNEIIKIMCEVEKPAVRKDNVPICSC